MIYAQLYHLSTGYNKEKNDFSNPPAPIEMCGCDGIVMLDHKPRFSVGTAKKLEKYQAETLTEIRRRITGLGKGIVGYEIIGAGSFQDQCARKLTPYVDTTKLTKGLERARA